MSNQLSDVRKVQAAAMSELKNILDGPNVLVSPDFRKLAGFQPAVVVDISVPAQHETLQLHGTFSLTIAGKKAAIHPARCELWVLAAGPRTPKEVTLSSELSSCSDSADTLYKLYFPVPSGSEWQFEIPRISSSMVDFSSAVHSGHDENGQVVLLEA